MSGYVPRSLQERALEELPEAYAELLAAAKLGEGLAVCWGIADEAWADQVRNSLQRAIARVEVLEKHARRA